MKPKPLLAIIAMLAASVVPIASGQEPSIVVRAVPQAAPSAAVAGIVDLSGPDTATSGDTVTIYLTGTPAIDLAKPLTSQLDWLMGEDAMTAYVLMPGQSAVQLDVEGTIVFASSGATMRPQVHFPAGQPGEYRVLADWNFGQNQLVEHMVTVSRGDDDNDDDDPTPDPDPEPEPTPGKLSVLLSYESGDQAGAAQPQADLLTDPQVRAYLDAHCVVVEGQPAWRFLDLSDDDGSNMSAQWQTVIARARGKTTPWLIIDNGKDTYEGTCPASAAELLAKLKQYGGA